MKKIFALVLVLCLSAGIALAETTDAFTSASVNNYYGKLEGDELMSAINSASGFYAVSTVNPDGTPNVAFFIYSCVKAGDTYYLQLGLAPNQTTANIDNGSEVKAMYAPVPAEGTYPLTGARLMLKKVTDEALLAELLTNAPAGFSPMYYEVTEVLPLG